MTKAEHRSLVETIILAQQDALNSMRLLLDDLHNRSPLEPRQRTAPPTKLVRNKIRLLHRNGMSQQKIAHKLDISIGRVSETLRGKRT